MFRVAVLHREESAAVTVGRALAAHDIIAECMHVSDPARAQSMLQAGPIDLMVLDLAAPEEGHLQLLHAIGARLPEQRVFGILGDSPSEAADLLLGLQNSGWVTHIDAPELAPRLRETLSNQLSGQLRNIRLPSFLQLLEGERKTCTLRVAHQTQTANLYLRSGELIGARVGDLTGEEAAFEVSTWGECDLQIDAHCGLVEREFNLRLGFILMEGLRLLDERMRQLVEGRFGPLGAPEGEVAEASAEEPDIDVEALFDSGPSDPAPGDEVAEAVETQTPEAAAPRPPADKALEELAALEGVLGALRVDTQSGAVLSSHSASGDPLELETLASQGAAELRAKLELLGEAHPRVARLAPAPHRPALVTVHKERPERFLMVVASGAGTPLGRAEEKLRALTP